MRVEKCARKEEWRHARKRGVVCCCWDWCEGGAVRKRGELEEERAVKGERAVGRESREGTGRV